MLNPTRRCFRPFSAGADVPAAACGRREEDHVVYQTAQQSPGNLSVCVVNSSVVYTMLL